MNQAISVQPQSRVYLQDASQWSTGICHCCRTCKQCCRSVWCFPCIACRTAERHGECYCLPLVDICSIISPIAMSLRATTRERYSIQGNFCVDCLFAMFCCPCVYCQIQREIDYRQLPTTLGDIVQRK